MSKEKVVAALNEQIRVEFYSWYSYLSMSAWCSRKQLNGCARWLRAQAQEEYTHAMKLYEFLVDRDAEVQLQPIDSPKEEFDSIVNVFECALEQEVENSRRIDNLFQLALEQKSFASLVELQWFVTEQVEEEKSARENLTKIKMVKDDPAAILDFDQMLSERQLTLDTTPQ
jgi:ferritin